MTIVHDFWRRIMIFWWCLTCSILSQTLFYIVFPVNIFVENYYVCFSHLLNGSEMHSVVFAVVKRNLLSKLINTKTASITAHRCLELVATVLIHQKCIWPWKIRAWECLNVWDRAVQVHIRCVIPSIDNPQYHFDYWSIWPVMDLRLSNAWRLNAGKRQKWSVIVCGSFLPFSLMSFFSINKCSCRWKESCSESIIFYCQATGR